MNKAFVTYLGSDDFLPGILALYQSLKDVHSKEKLTVLVTPDISIEARTFLSNLDIEVKPVDHILNPENPSGSHKFKLKNAYTKLHIFRLVEYERLVYIDGDMLVCTNIDELLDKPHFSAVNAGGMLQEYSDWVDLNAGLLVIEPSIKIFKDLMSKVDVLSSNNCGDQGFLHSYFPDWPNQPKLHLNHGYNLCVGHLDRYHERFNFVFPQDLRSTPTNTIKVLHFWGDHKPWLPGSPLKMGQYHQQAWRMWHECYRRALGKLYKTVDIL